MEAYKELAQENLLPIKVVLQLLISECSDIHIYKQLGLTSWEKYNPLYGIYCAVNRKDLMGYPVSGWISEEGLSLNEAISLYSEKAAYASKEELEKGGFEVGMKADFVVLSADLGKSEKDKIKDITVEKTFVDGVEIQ